MGFNGVRKHQKIESARYLYWADKPGSVWCGRKCQAPIVTQLSRSNVSRNSGPKSSQRDRSHPCIVAWVPFNESWGVPDLPDSSAQRHYVQALYHLTKSLDPTRPVIGNDGWESIATDIIGIHDYDDDPERIGLRYGISDIEAKLLKRERPGGRMLFVGENKALNRPIMLTEFGGIAMSKDQTNPQDSWGYSRTASSTGLIERYTALLKVVRSLPTLAGFCYTQFTDTYQEANGLLFADRTPKAPIQQIALATSGLLPRDDNEPPPPATHHRMG